MSEPGSYSKWATLADQAVDDVLRELVRQQRLKQEGKFAKTCADDMTNLERFSVLAEKFGEVGHELNEGIGEGRKVDTDRLRRELVQVAAVCVAWMQGLEGDKSR